MKNNGWIDITQPMSNQLAHWPGDIAFTYELAATKKGDEGANVGRLEVSCHNGTHIDAPFHYDSDGLKVIDLDLDLYIGKARVIDVSEKNHIDAAYLQKFNLEGIERLLLHSSLPNDPTRFPENYPSLAPDIASFLREKGIRLLGIDMPSVDTMDNTAKMTVHQALYENDIYILENAMLDHVTPGDYQLIALPLAIVEGDGSPVRAVLKPL